MDIKISFSNLSTIKGRKNPKGKAPFVEKPITFYNMMFRQIEPERTQFGLDFSIFGSLFKTSYSKPKTITETKQNYTYATKTETKSEQKIESIIESKVEKKVESIIEKKVDTKVETALKFDSLKKTEAKTKNLSTKTSKFKPSELAAKTVSFAVKTITLPITLPFKGVKMLFEKISDLRTEYKYNKIYKNIQLNNLQEKFERDLNKYKNLFEIEDMKPNFVKYNLFKGLSYKNLAALHTLLLSDIKRQQNLLNVKRTMKQGADGYNGRNGGCSDAKFVLEDICPRHPKYDNCKNYQEELKRLCKIYIDNSKNFELPLKNFNEIIKNFFARNSKKLQEIYDIQNDKVIKTLEKIPKLGIIPKGLRIYEQWNLANCITKDFRVVTDKHVYYGIHPAALKYNEQYNTILNFAEKHRTAFSENNALFTDEMLKIIEKNHSEREKVYTKLYDRFITGGCNMKKICQKTKLRGGADIAKKTVLTLIPFIC